MKIDYKYIFNNFIILRLITIFASIIGLIFLDFKPSFPYADPVLIKYGSPLLWSWANFDGVHYLLLSEQGYAFGLTQAFFPLYFLLIRFFNFFINNRLITGLILSHFFYFLSLILFYKLIRLDFNKKVAKQSLLFLIFFPTSFFFLSVYTESLFLFLLLCCFYLIRTKNWFLASIIGIFLTLTRLVGIFIIPAFLYEIYLLFKEKNQKENVLNKFSNYIYGLIPIIGLIIYMLFLKQKFGDPLLFAHVQEGFGSGRETDKLVLLYQVLWRYLKMIFTVDKTNPLYFTIWFELSMSLIILILLIKAYLKKIRLSYLIFAFPAWLLPTLTGTLSSMPRYVLVLFPAFIILGQIKNNNLKYLILSIFLGLLIICTTLFTRGYWVS